MVAVFVCVFASFVSSAEPGVAVDVIVRCDRIGATELTDGSDVRSSVS